MIRAVCGADSEISTVLDHGNVIQTFRSTAESFVLMSEADFKESVVSHDTCRQGEDLMIGAVVACGDAVIRCSSLPEARIHCGTNSCIRFQRNGSGAFLLSSDDCIKRRDCVFFSPNCMPLFNFENSRDIEEELPTVVSEWSSTRSLLGSFVFGSSDKKTLSFFDIRKAEQISFLQTQSVIDGVRFHDSKPLVLTFGSVRGARAAQLWDVRSAKLLAAYDFDNDGGHHTAVSGRRLDMCWDDDTFFALLSERSPQRGVLSPFSSSSTVLRLSSSFSNDAVVIHPLKRDDPTMMLEGILLCEGTLLGLTQRGTLVKVVRNELDTPAEAPIALPSVSMRRAQDGFTLDIKSAFRIISGELSVHSTASDICWYNILRELRKKGEPRYNGVVKETPFDFESDVSTLPPLLKTQRMALLARLRGDNDDCISILRDNLVSDSMKMALMAISHNLAVDTCKDLRDVVSESDFYIHWLLVSESDKLTEEYILSAIMRPDVPAQFVADAICFGIDISKSGFTFHISQNILRNGTCEEYLKDACDLCLEDVQMMLVVYSCSRKLEAWGELEQRYLKSISSPILQSEYNYTRRVLFEEPTEAHTLDIEKNDVSVRTDPKNPVKCTVCHGSIDFNTGTDSSNWYAWCSICMHGGHLAHLDAWFQHHNTCPFPLCPCACRGEVNMLPQ